ncbi:MAG: MBL fold metallo-hydrolase [Candidatus Dormiibacterota bacterium]
MDATWYGHACFRLRGRRATVVTDPYPSTLGAKAPKLDAQLVTISHPSENHSFTGAVPDDAYVISGPGEYEVAEVTVRGLDTFQSAPDGGERKHNTIYVVEIDDVRICHLGDLGQMPDEQLEERIGDVDLLLLPVGGGTALDATAAAEVVRQIEPRYVVPMHYGLPQLRVRLEPLDRFVQEMGITDVEPQAKLTVQASASAESEMKVVVLEPRLG